jgi:hypothetical protein
MLKIKSRRATMTKWGENDPRCVPGFWNKPAVERLKLIREWFRTMETPNAQDQTNKK